EAAVRGKGQRAAAARLSSAMGGPLSTAFPCRGRLGRSAECEGGQAMTWGRTGKEAMVARASVRMWVGTVVSLAAMALLVDWVAPAAWAQQAMSRAHRVLNTAIDCYRQGDYDNAAIFFQQAQSMQEDLTPAEKDELTTNLLRNNQALQGRRDGAEQIRRAEDALQAGRTQEANALLKSVFSNQFLSPADKQ